MSASTVGAAATTLLLLLTCAQARAQDGGRVEVSDSPVLISLALPDGFGRLGAQEVAAQYTRGVRPLAVFREPRRELRVTVNTFDAAQQKTGSVAALRRRLESDAAAAFPEAEWLSRDTARIGGLDWARLRFKAEAGIGRVVSDLYATVWGGKAVLVNFYCPATGYEAARAELEKSAASLRLSLLVVAPPAAKPAPRKRRP